MDNLIQKDKDFFNKFDFKEKDGFFETNEYSSVFNHNALNPKVNFSENEIFSKSQIFQIKRSLLSFFGIPAYGVHCNGWRFHKNSIIMVMALRSKKLKTYPEHLDNLIAGGQPANLSLRHNLEKEAYEEAGLSKKEMKRAVFKSFKSYFPVHEKYFKPSIIGVYDLKLKKNEIFINQDGEINEFIELEIHEILELLDKKKLKPNAIIPIVDFLIREEETFFNKNCLKEIKKILR